MILEICAKYYGKDTSTNVGQLLQGVYSSFLETDQALLSFSVGID